MNRMEHKKEDWGLRPENVAKPVDKVFLMRDKEETI
jgi:hypothetical protein